MYLQQHEVATNSTVAYILHALLRCMLIIEQFDQTAEYLYTLCYT